MAGFGRAVCTDDEARGSPALAAYVLGVRRTLRRPCSRVELHDLPSGTVAAVEHTDRSLANRVRRAEDIAVDITVATEAVARGEDPDVAFPTQPGMQCSWCDFRPSCRTGQAAAPTRETWSFLAEDDAASVAPRPACDHTGGAPAAASTKLPMPGLLNLV